MASHYASHATDATMPTFSTSMTILSLLRTACVRTPVLGVCGTHGTVKLSFCRPRSLTETALVASTGQLRRRLRLRGRGLRKRGRGATSMMRPHIAATSLPARTQQKWHAMFVGTSRGTSRQSALCLFRSKRPTSLPQLVEVLAEAPHRIVTSDTATIRPRLVYLSK